MALLIIVIRLFLKNMVFIWKLMGRSSLLELFCGIIYNFFGKIIGKNTFLGNPKQVQ